MRPLAAGGMAQVYLASFQGPGGYSKLCVVKRLKPDLSKDSHLHELFAHEAKVASCLSHANIVEVFDFGSIHGQDYLAMEYVEGVSLEELMRVLRTRGQAVELGLAVYVALQISRALAHAHSAVLPSGEALELVHRDISPGNILLSRSGQVKLTDFGVGKSVASPEFDVPGRVPGKYGYISPEQAAGRPVDARTDLYSLGVVLFEMATGRYLVKRPADGAETSLTELDAPPPSAIMQGLPKGLEPILLKLLARTPENRYDSAARTTAALEQAQVTLGLAAGALELASLIGELFPEAAASPKEPPPVRLQANIPTMLLEISGDESEEATIIADEIIAAQAETLASTVTVEPRPAPRVSRRAPSPPSGSSTRSSAPSSTPAQASRLIPQLRQLFTTGELVAGLAAGVLASSVFWLVALTLR